MDTSVAVPLLVASQGARNAPRELANRGVAGGAVYDGLVALAAREHGAVLVTRDVRARSTYEVLGVTVDILATGDFRE